MNWMTKHVASVLVLVVSGAVVLTAGGQDASTRKRNAKSALSLEQQEPAVLRFVSANHSELSPLLVSLKKHSPQQYERAVRDLHRVQQRLDTMRERDSERYELEIKKWQAKSRAQLVAAQLAVSDSVTLQQQLKRLVAQHLKLRAQLLKRDRRRQQDRLKKLNEQIAQVSKPEALEHEVEVLLRTVRRNAQQPSIKAKAASTRKATSKAAAKKTTSPNTDKKSASGRAAKPDKK